MSLHALGKKVLDEGSFVQSMGAVLKSHSDIERVKAGGLVKLMEESEF